MTVLKRSASCALGHPKNKSLNEMACGSLNENDSRC
jgi:hypothetical protein